MERGDGAEIERGDGERRWRGEIERWDGERRWIWRGR